VHLRTWSTASCDGRPAGTGVSDVLATAQTDAGGRFAFRDVPSPAVTSGWRLQHHPWDVVVLAEGRAVAWEHLTPPAQQRPLLLPLAPEARLEGTVVGAAGRPLAGARVQALDVAPLGQAPLDPSALVEDALNLHGSRIDLSTTTDGRGRFVLGGLPARRRIGLRVEAEGHVGRTAYAATTAEPQPGVFEAARPRFPARVEPVHAGPLALALQPA